MKKCVTCIILSIFSFSLLWSQNTPEPYTKEEFKPWVHQLRRSEIVTLGSLPFTTLSTTLGYSIYKYATQDVDSNYNPFFASQSNFTAEDQKRILLISVSASLIVGIVDFTISMIKQNKVTESQKIETPPYTIQKIVIESSSPKTESDHGVLEQ